jgi:hypothetical protein
LKELEYRKQFGLSPKEQKIHNQLI